MISRWSQSTLTGILLAIIVSLSPPTPAGDAQGTHSKSGFVTTADGVRIHYLEAGKGPAILFIPAWTMPAEVWEPQMAHFSRTHRVVAMDPRSQGQSDKPNEGHFPAMRARDIRAVVDQLRLAPVVLVGWSLGVAELLSYVDQFGTDTAAALVLIDDTGGGEFDAESLAWLGRFQRDRARETDTLVRSFYKRAQPESYLRRMAAASLQTPTPAAVALLIGKWTTDNNPALVKVNRPTLVCAAADTPYEHLVRGMAARIPGARLERFSNAGHALFVDDAPHFNSLLASFLVSLK